MAFQPDWSNVHLEDKWKILRVQWRFGLWALYSAIGSVMTGFDWGASGYVTALPSFQKQFGIPYPEQPSGYLIPARYLSGWSGAATGGDIIGILIAGQLIEWIGRKHSLLIGTIITAVGIGMQFASQEWILFLCGRLVNAIGFGIVYILSPVWIGENVRPELRGFFLCLMNGAIVFGQLVLAGTARGVSTIQGEWSYKTLILLQFIFVAPLLMFYPWFPESPSYLLRKGREEEARKSLNRIHGSGDQSLIKAEMIRIQSNITFDDELRAAAGAQSNKPKLVQCFIKPNLKRTLISNIAVIQQQCVGSTFVLGFFTYFISLLGINDYFTVTLALSVIMFVSCILAFPLIEIVGRRKLILPGTFTLTATLLVIGVCGCFNTKAANWIFLVSVFAWGAIYQCTLGGVGFALGGEIPSLTMRASTVSLMGFCQMAGVWVVSFVVPYLINPDAANLGAKVGFIFFGLSLPFCVLMYFFIPETKGISFTEMDYLFTSGVSCRRFPEAVARYRLETNGSNIDRDIGAVLEAKGEILEQVERV